MLNRLKPKILIISNDAGATEYIAHLILQEYNQANWVVYALINSPAFKIFTKLNIDFTILNSVEDVEEAIREEFPDIVLYGTGWQIDFHHIVEKMRKKYHIKSIALLDHWINYKERLKSSSLPQNIMIMDDVAYQMANNVFDDSVNIFQLRCHYLDNIEMLYNSISKKDNSSVVFISEPTSIIAEYNLGDENAYGFTEYSVVEELIEFFDELIIRLHPADSLYKYDDILQKYPNKQVTIVYPYNEELVETLSRSKLTIGFDGMALFISYFLGIDTISYMPTKKRELTIPMPKDFLIDDLKELKKINFNQHSVVELNSNEMTFGEVIKRVLES